MTVMVKQSKLVVIYRKTERVQHITHFHCVCPRSLSAAYDNVKRTTWCTQPTHMGVIEEIYIIIYWNIVSLKLQSRVSIKTHYAMMKPHYYTVKGFTSINFQLSLNECVKTDKFPWSALLKYYFHSTYNAISHRRNSNHPIKCHTQLLWLPVTSSSQYKCDCSQYKCEYRVWKLFMTTELFVINSYQYPGISKHLRRNCFFDALSIETRTGNNDMHYCSFLWKIGVFSLKMASNVNCVSTSYRHPIFI